MSFHQSVQSPCPLGTQQVPPALGPLPPCPLVSLGPEQAVAFPLVAEPAGRVDSVPGPQAGEGLDHNQAWQLAPSNGS